MIQSDENFIRYYDKLFLNKDYTKETNYILNSFERYGTGKINNILDVGCGTGAHTIEFANLGYNITGIDVDKQMIDLAKTKTNKINFIYDEINKHKFNNKFELVFSFFYVVNYIETIKELNDFLSGVYKNIGKGGIFVFDGWNGNRIPVDPPQKKEIIIKEKNFYAKGYLYPNYDAFNNASLFNYKININDNGKEVKYENTLPQTYWSPLVLKQLLYDAGFTDVIIFGHLSHKIATIEDYKLCWICQK